MTDYKSQLLDVYLREFDKLKSEQIARIGFRDNLIYVTIVAVGGILSFALTSLPNYNALLLVPWATLILGWTYLVNDEKISAIGKYIRLTLVEKIRENIGKIDVEILFGWEIAHRSDSRRVRRKIEQLFIDEITFVFSGFIGLILFWLLSPNSHLIAQIASVIEFLLLIILGLEIAIYADLTKGRNTKTNTQSETKPKKGMR